MHRRGNRALGWWCAGLAVLSMLLVPGWVFAQGELPRRVKMLNWSPAERQLAYSHTSKIFSTQPVSRGPHEHVLPVSHRQLGDVSYSFGEERGSVQDYMSRNHVAGLLVMKQGQIVLERYALGLQPQGRWASFAVAASVTSTLIGAAIRDGFIHGVDDAVTEYIPELKGTAYDGVSLVQMLEMRSGVRWNENLADPDSDITRLNVAVEHNGDSAVAQMARLPRGAPPGTQWTYNSGEADLLGIVVMRATGMPLATYLSQKIWVPYGMERDAAWITSGGREVADCCISMTLRDYGRFGQFFMGGGKADGVDVLPPDWTQRATSSYTADLPGARGYGWQWWIMDQRSYAASGVFGQSLIVDPAHELVVVNLSAWPEASWPEGRARADAFLAAIRQVTDPR